MNILRKTNFSCRVSSVLNKDVKQYGKQHMFDENEVTSWSSDKGTSQWISLSLDEPQTVNGFCFQFQGGFAGQKSNITLYSQEGNIVYKESFYPEDNNSPQHFKVNDVTSHKIKFVFESTTDLFGRVIIYRLEILN